jgi:transposase
MSQDASSSPSSQPPSSGRLPNDELPNDLAALKAIVLQQQATITQLAQTNTEYQQSIEQLGHRIALLLKRHYGPRREYINPDQLLLFSQDELDALTKEMAAQLEPHPTIPDAVLPEDNAKSSKKHRKTGHGRRALPDSLPREQRLHELTGEALKCPCCGQDRCEFSRESSEQLDYIPPQFKVIQHIRVKYVCQSCEEHIAIAPKPPQPIDRGLPGPGLMAFVVLGKYGDHQPLYPFGSVGLHQFFASSV